jgi:hypothetical protein
MTGGGKVDIFTMQVGLIVLGIIAICFEQKKIHEKSGVL